MTIEKVIDCAENDSISLRDRQKMRRRNSMLDAARQLFVETGYHKTTMEGIAARAELGVATLYTYFGTKDALFAALARRDMSELEAEGARLLQDPPEDPVEAVNELLTIYNKVHKFISYSVIRDFLAEARADNPLRETARWIREWMAAQLTQALDHAKSEGRLSPELPTRDAAEIIRELAFQYFEHAPQPRFAQEAFQKLKRRVALVFADWRA